MCDYPFFIPQVVLFANSSLFWFKVTNEHREFRNYLNEINSREERPRYYNQINVAIDTEWEFTIQEEGGTSTTTILEYCKRLLM